jgi:hypothetical protein
LFWVFVDEKNGWGGVRVGRPRRLKKTYGVGENEGVVGEIGSEGVHRMYDRARMDVLG